MKHILHALFCSLIVLTPILLKAQVSSSSAVLRYCNPLPMETGAGGQASGDVTVIKENGIYYMYCTGGGVWHSKDMLNWSFQRVENIPVAPHVVRYKGKFYLCGNDGPLYASDAPTGPFVSLGDWKNTPGVAGGWNGPFDVDIFVDDDGKPYLYYPGRGVSGIFVVELDPNDLSRFAGPVKHLFGFNNTHLWERYGEMNEYPDVAWIEGPWVQKYKGTYYLQYSASGTQWKTYAEGYYTSKSPLGPFVYAPNNPLLRKTDGLVTGTAHGSIVEGPDGNLWQFYTIVLSNPPGGRRIGMDRIVIDKQGLMSVNITETPQPAPVKKGSNPAASSIPPANKPSIPLTINKFRSMNALSTVSSEKYGHEAAYAVDNSSGTWWEPEATDSMPFITIDLAPATRFDVVQQFKIDSYRLLFNRGRSGNRGSFVPDIYRYKIEASSDGKTFTTVVDETANSGSRNTIFGEIPPITCRMVRLTLTNWPKNTPLGLIEWTVFGKPDGSTPAKEPIPVFN